MKKDFIRDYATAAFIIYSEMGKPSDDKLYKELYVYAIEKCGLKSSEKAHDLAIMSVQYDYGPLIADIEAVNTTISQLRNNGLNDIEKAVDGVYFKITQKENELRKRNFSNMVRNYACENAISEKDIYVKLKIARTLFAYNRGLRIPDYAYFLRNK